MYYLRDFCCICLCYHEILQQLSTTDNDNITYLSKIISSVPEMSHSVMNEQRLICKECCNNINISYKFRQQCLKSKTILVDYILQLRSVSNVSGKISICLNDFRLQQDKACVKSKDKEAIDTLSLINEIKTEPVEEHFIDVNCLKMEEILQEDYVRLGDDCTTNPLHIEVKNETNIDSVNQITKYSPILFDNQEEKELINKLNFDIKVESKIKNNVAYENLYSLNEIKTEQNEINSNVFDSQLTEELIIKTEVNTEDDENYLDESDDEYYTDKNNDSSSDDELNRNKITTNCSYECTICKIAFTQSDVLEAHMKVHATKQDNVCTICNKIFADVHVVSEHMKTHKGKQRHECSLCKKTFTYLRNLNRHLKSHECTICKKVFTYSHYLTKHMITHTGNRLYECTICTKNFLRPDHLKIHMRTHTGKQPFECGICKKPFSWSEHLKNHMRTHIGKRPYECTLCKKSFSASYNLTRHMRTHAGERPYECSVFKKTFIQSDHLNRHMRTRAEEQTFKCSVCNKKLSCASALSRHMKNIHKNDKM